MMKAPDGFANAAKARRAISAAHIDALGTEVRGGIGRVSESIWGFHHGKSASSAQDYPEYSSWAILFNIDWEQRSGVEWPRLKSW
jgi:hypothetical protein